MNIFSSLANVLTGRKVDDDGELSSDEQAAQDKAERIKFHRERVRNGPVKFTQLTNGQIRRAEARATRREIQRNFRRDVRNHLETARVAAVLRGQLQIVGLIPFLDGREAPLEQQVRSTIWIVKNYSPEVIAGEKRLVSQAFRRGDILDALATAARFYQAATGMIITIPKDFEPAIVVDEDAA